jgi:hypothetical protein
VALGHGGSGLGCFAASAWGLHHYFLPLFWLSPAALLEGWRLARAQDGQGALGQQELAATSQK